MTEHPAVMMQRLLEEKHNLILDNERMRQALNRVMIAGNHIANWRDLNWPDYPLDGLTRDQQCELALRTLGATRQYDMWCCWSAIMQVRDSLSDNPVLNAEPSTDQTVLGGKVERPNREFNSPDRGQL